MRTTTDIHQQFAEYFRLPALKPFAYLLSKSLAEGSICLNVADVESKRAALPQWYHSLLQGTDTLVDIPLIAKDGSDTQPFVLHEGNLYLQRYYRYETSCLQRIRQFAAEEAATLASTAAALSTHRAYIKALFTGGAGPDWQLAAAITAALHHFTIITGGPGTGKTTTVAKLLAVLFKITPGLKVTLAAPTGKAAARMAESLKSALLEADPVIKESLARLVPSTLHRLLRSKVGTPYFHHGADHPLPFDVVIVDESSMIDVALFAKLLCAVGPGTRLILLGDKDQLASVEAGSLFGDLCTAQEQVNLFSEERLAFINSFAGDAAQVLHADASEGNAAHPLFGHIIGLRHSHRFSADQGIGRFSKAVIESDTEAINAFLKTVNEDVRIDEEWSSGLFEEFIVGYYSFIEEQDTSEALKKLAALRVLCATREGPQGLYAVNKAIEAFLHRRGWIEAGVPLYEHRPILLTRNYYEHNLFNGDTGILRRDERGILMAWFQDGAGGVKSVLPGYIPDVETAFAMTIHKSQGSEFDDVLVLLPAEGAESILTRELLYTAVTRAKKRVLIQASAPVLLHTLSRSVERASGIASRLHVNAG